MKMFRRTEAGSGSGETRGAAWAATLSIVMRALHPLLGKTRNRGRAGSGPEVHPPFLAQWYRLRYAFDRGVALSLCFSGAHGCAGLARLFHASFLAMGILAEIADQARLPKEIALHLFAVFLLQEAQLRMGLDTLGDDRQSKPPTKPENRPYDGCGLLIGVDRLDEGA